MACKITFQQTIILENTDLVHIDLFKASKSQMPQFGKFIIEILYLMIS